MSHSAHYAWQQREAARREQYLARIRSTTIAYAVRYEAILDDLGLQGLDAFIPAESAHIAHQLAMLRQLLSSDPEQARNLSQQLASEVHGLRGLAIQAQQFAIARENERKQKQALHIGSMLEQAFTAIIDPVERDFAYLAATDVRADIAARLGQQQSLSQLQNDVDVRLQEILTRAREQATNWKAARRNDLRAQVHTEVLQHARTAVLGDAQRAPPALSDKVAQAWDKLETIADADEGSFAAALAAATNEADEAIIDEESRRATVRAVFESLQRAGFAVAPPHKDGGDNDDVLITARKPSGAQAVFKVNAAGGLSYKFDHYEGAACKQDINQVMPMLQQIYGISLSNERILWENPDRLSRDARPLDDKEAQR
jgi:hypothetical protein